MKRRKLLPFWDEQCSSLSKKLWKPPDNMKPHEDDTGHWNCDHKDISFTKRVPDGNVFPDIKFSPLPVHDNSSEKYSLFFKMFRTEISRFNKSVIKNKISKKNVLDYLRRLEKINDNIDKSMKVASKNLKFFKDIMEEYDSLKNIISNEEEHLLFEVYIIQVNKIFAKMNRLDEFIYCKKIKMHLTNSQRETIMGWMMAS